MKLLNAKGTKDFGQEEMIVRQKVMDSLKSIFELYGFSPAETPVLERFDLLSSKYAGGDEILKETFKLKDQGGRELGLRYDLTVPFCRFIGMNPNLKMPVKRYQIGTVYRDGPVASDRLREFTQCDVDIVGSRNMLADAQIVQIAQRFFDKIEIEVIIEVNNRKLLDGVLDSLKIPDKNKIDVILAIDKIKKIPIKDLEKELAEKGVKKEQVDELFNIFKTGKSNKSELERLRKLVKTPKGIEGLNEIEELLSYVDEKNVVFSISLARGLAYYTGSVFEIFLKKQDGSAICAGGRYDKMIAEFLGNRNEYPAVGISFGLDRIAMLLKNNKKTVTKVFIIPIQTTKECISIAEEMRDSGINTDMDVVGRGISKNLDFANSLNIPYVLFVGPDEIKAKKVKLRDMKSGKEEMLGVVEVIEKLKK